MTERISVLMDGELDSDAAGVEAEFLRNDNELREVWDAYHLIGDVMRGDLYQGYERRVAAGLAKEPTVLAPQRRPENRIRRYARYAFSAAASAAAVALVVLTASPMQDMSQLTIARNNVPIALPSQAAEAARGVEDYLLAHQRFSPSNAMQGLAPYVRLVAEEREDATR